MKKTIFTLLLAAVVSFSCNVIEDSYEKRYLASDTNDVQLYAIDGNKVSESKKVARGGQVKANVAKVVEIDAVKYYPVEKVGEDQFIYAKEQSLVNTLEEVVQEKTIWVRTPASIIGDVETSLVVGLADKGAELNIVGFESLAADGSVARYKVQQGAEVGYVYTKYLVRTKEEAEQRYEAAKYDKVHAAIKNSFGGGEAIGCDFYPVERVKFENNKMPEACYSLYLNSSPSVIGNIEKFITFAKQTKINTFVIDIKDNECPGYKAEAMEKYSPTNHR